jgi:hypothetical protein
MSFPVRQRDSDPSKPPQFFHPVFFVAEAARSRNTLPY